MRLRPCLVRWRIRFMGSRIRPMRRPIRQMAPPLRQLPSRDDEADAGGTAAADVQGLEGLRPLDLVVPGSPGDLLVAVEDLTHAGGAHRMTRADEAPARIDGVLAADLEPARLDRLPALTGLGDAEVVDR